MENEKERMAKASEKETLRADGQGICRVSDQTEEREG
jgi:hypothetical protein